MIKASTYVPVLDKGYNIVSNNSTKLILQKRTYFVSKPEPKTLAEQMDSDEKPIRVGYDEFIDADYCPYCGHILTNSTTGQLKCPKCNHLLAWY